MSRNLMICSILVLILVSCTSSSYAERLGVLNNTTVTQDATLLKNMCETTNMTFPPGIAPKINASQLTGVGLSISGTAFNDSNGDGLRAHDEPGLLGRSIILEHGGKEVRTTTNDSGRYIFSNLEAGRYTVTENMAANWSQTCPGAGNYTINLVDKDATNYDFGNILGPDTYVPQEHPIMAKSAWNQRTQAIKNLPRAGTSPEGIVGASYPSSFNLLSHLPYTASERDQGNCGNCWVWGCMAPIEIANDIQNGVHDRLSIQYLNSNYNGGSGSGWACCGGWELGFQSFYNTHGKFIPWSNSNANYQDGGRRCSGGTSVHASSISTTPNYPVTSIQWHEIQTAGVSTTQAISNIKSYLYANKAVTLAFYLPNFQPFWSFWSSNSGNWNPDSYCGLSDGAYPGGHEVTVVGWEDSTNSWIVLNSWGIDSAHPDGTFKLKMDMNYNCINGGWYSYSFGYFDVAFSDSNLPPNTPSIPSGPSSGAAGTSYSYSTSTTDPDGDQVTYTFDWGDGTTSNTVQVNSGTTGSASHIWSGAGTYDVEARTTDSEGAISGWSNSRAVSISNSLIRPSEIGLYWPTIATWYLDNSGNRAWDGTPTDLTGVFGTGLTGGLSVAGDWNGDDKAEIGLYVPSTATWYLDYNGNRAWDGTPVDLTGVFGRGLSGALPVAGDWNGDGKAKIGLYWPTIATWYLDYNGNRAWDGTPTDLTGVFGTGLTGALPIAGDWNGDGKAKIGLYWPTISTWYLDYNGNRAWDGTPTDLTGVFGTGLTGAQAVVGDWNGSGFAKIGLYWPTIATWYLDSNGNRAWDGIPTDLTGVFGTGLTGAKAIAGAWG